MRPLGNVIYFMPPYVINKKEITFVSDVMREAINEATKKNHRIYINSEFKSNNILCTTELSHRITNVLRMKNDEKLSVFNNIREYEACLSIDGKKFR